MDRIADHRRRAGPELDSRAEVFGPVHLHRSTQGKRGADGVRTAGALVPDRSGLEPDVPGPFHRCRVADRLEDRPRGIGEDHDGPRLRKEVSGLFRDRHARTEQVTMRVLKRPQGLFRKRHRRLRALGIHSRRATTLPGPFDHVPYGMRRHVMATQELLPGCHHPPFLIRLWERRESFLRCHVASSIPTTPPASLDVRRRTTWETVFASKGRVKVSLVTRRLVLVPLGGPARRGSPRGTASGRPAGRSRRRSR